MKRSFAALLLATTALLTASCSSSQSGGDSYPDNQFTRDPAASASPAR